MKEQIQQVKLNSVPISTVAQAMAQAKMEGKSLGQYLTEILIREVASCQNNGKSKK